MNNDSLNTLRVNLSVKSKNGLDFTLSAGIVWLVIAYVWTLSWESYDKSVLTFIVGPMLIPVALLLSKLFKTIWADHDNPLQPLGLWLNFAQLFYFPFLVFSLIKIPDYFVMVYAIITAGHFFPYAWFYKTKLYAIFAGFLSFGALLFGLFLPVGKMYIIPVFMSISLIILSVLLFFDSRNKRMQIMDK